MKYVTLVSLSTKTEVVCDQRDHIDHRSFDPSNMPVMVNSSPEFFPELMEVETSPIIKVVKNNITNYICVKNEVWEYLYCIENPVTAKAQEDKIKRLTKESRDWHQEAIYISATLKDFKHVTLRASIFTRIKWVFTGVIF